MTPRPSRSSTSGEERRNNVMWGVAFSPDGELIALGTEFSGVVLVDVGDGRGGTCPARRREATS